MSDYNNMMEVNPDEDLRRWSVQQTVMELAPADYYYTKTEVDNLLKKLKEEILNG